MRARSKAFASDFHLHQHLITLGTVKKHRNGDSVGSFLIDQIGQIGVGSDYMVCTAKGS